MLRAPMAVRPFLAFALLALVVPLSACQRRIGAACKVSTDCSIRGDRICDLSHLVDGDGNVSPSGKGECTIDGCNSTTCPREGSCVQVYNSEFLSIACDPDLEDRPQTFSKELEPRIAACNANPATPALGDPVSCNDCGVHEVCLPEGLCADLLSVRTSCRKACRSDSKCRDGYECRETGTNGVYRVATPEYPFGDGTISICMPVRPDPLDDEE